MHLHAWINPIFPSPARRKKTISAAQAPSLVRSLAFDKAKSLFAIPCRFTVPGKDAVIRFIYISLDADNARIPAPASTYPKHHSLPYPYAFTVT
jgi:hypothetical protein